jgi:hypothetical protein
VSARLSARYESALTVLLVVQCLVLFFATPLVAVGELPAPYVGESLMAIFGMLLVALSEGRGPTVLASAIVVLAMVAAAVNIIAPNPVLGTANHIGSIVIMLLVGLVVSRAVFAPGPVSAHRVRGAIVMYLTIGLTFSAIYRLIHDWVPTAFVGIPPGIPRGESFGSILYFSLVTLTSVGYGDITPVHPFARSMANLEAVIGQLYPATLLARLVTLQLETRRRS